MSKLLRVVFGAIIVAGLGAFDYVQVSREQSTAAALGLATPEGYFASLRDRLMPRAARGAAKETPIALADYLAEAPRGWDRRPYEPADGEHLADQPLQPTESLRSTTNDLLHRLRLTAPGTSRWAETYQKGAELVVISLALGAPAPVADVTRADYAVVRGLPMALLDQVDLNATAGTEAPAPYRRLVAAFGTDAELMVITNAGDEALVAVLATLDLPKLAGRLGAPVAAISGGKPVFAGTAVIKAPLALPEVPEEEAVAEAQAPKGPCVRRGTVLTCE